MSTSRFPNPWKLFRENSCSRFFHTCGTISLELHRSTSWKNQIKKIKSLAVWLNEEKGCLPYQLFCSLYEMYVTVVLNITNPTGFWVSATFPRFISYISSRGNISIIINKGYEVRFTSHQLSTLFFPYIVYTHTNVKPQSKSILILLSGCTN